MTSGFIEGEGIINCIYVGSQGVIEAGNILCRGLGSFFIVNHLGYKIICLWKNVLGGRLGHSREEGNEERPFA